MKRSFLGTALSILALCISQATFSLSLATPARAAVIKTSSLDNWMLGSYTNDQTGQFSHCAAMSRYKSGITMLFAVNRNYAWSLGFANTSWNLTEGRKYPVSFTVDGRPSLQAQAYAVSNVQVKIDLADSTALFNDFRYGDMLTVFTAGQTFNFALTSTSRLLPALLECTRNYVNQGTTAAGGDNPFSNEHKATTPAPQPETQPARPAFTEAKNSDDGSLSRQVEATQLLANILGQAGVTSFQLLKPSEAFSLKADAAWRAGDSYGTLNVYNEPKPLKSEEYTAAIMSDDAKACTGKFASGAMPDDTNHSGTRLMTSCQTSEKTTTAYYSILQRPEGGHYVLATIGAEPVTPKIGGGEAPSNGGQKRVEGIDSGVRTAAYKIIQK